MDLKQSKKSTILKNFQASPSIRVRIQYLSRNFALVIRLLLKKLLPSQVLKQIFFWFFFFLVTRNIDTFDRHFVFSVFLHTKYTK